MKDNLFASTASKARDKQKDAMRAGLGNGLKAPFSKEQVGDDSQAKAVCVAAIPQEREATISEPILAEVHPSEPASVVTSATVKTKATRAKNDFESVIVPMPEKLKEAAEKLAKKIKKNNLKKQGQRITANSVYRGLISLINVLNIDISKVDSEDSLKEAILKAVTDRGV